MAFEIYISLCRDSPACLPLWKGKHMGNCRISLFRLFVKMLTYYLTAHCRGDPAGRPYNVLLIRQTLEICPYKMRLMRQFRGFTPTGHNITNNERRMIWIEESL
ncbi:MAG: hypothetical protein IEMM0008_1660 [bacterium]|nr:MAG: hypothetical protein IEMM0008_1660 [bacterium]